MALDVVKKRFQYIFSGLRGPNFPGISPYALRRDSVTPEDPISLLGAFLEGAADFHYRQSCRQLDDWVRR